MRLSKPLMRRAFLMGAALAASPVLAGQALAVPNAAENFVEDNIHKGLDILNNKRLSTEQRRDQFESLLLGAHRHEAHRDVHAGPISPHRLARRSGRL